MFESGSQIHLKTSKKTSSFVRQGFPLRCKRLSKTGVAEFKPGDLADLQVSPEASIVNGSGENGSQ